MLAFITVAALVVVTPGQDTALTVRSTLVHGRGAGVRTAVGVVCGQAVSALAASAGFCAMTLAWLVAYATVVHWAGDAVRRPRLRRTLDAIMGTTLVAFGTRLATSERHAQP